MFLSKRMSLNDMLFYWAAEVIGAILAAAVVLVILHFGPGNYDAHAAGFAANGYGEHSPVSYSMLSAFLAEMFLTMILVVTVLGTTDNRAPAGFAGIPIGLTLTAIHFAGVPVTNGSFTPARSIPPAFFVGGGPMEQICLFIVVPVVRALLPSPFHLSLTPS